MSNPNLRSITFFLGRPGHEMYAVTSTGIVNVDGQMDILRRAASRPDFVGVVSKAPATQWGGQFWMDVNPDHQGNWMFKGHDSPTPESAAVKLRALAAKAKAAEMSVMTDAAKYLERELKGHDWYAAFSDSYGATLAGDAHMKVIERLLEKVPHDLGLRLWNKYAPKEYDRNPYDKMASRVASRYMSMRKRAIYRKGVIIRENYTTLQSIPTDPPYNQAYDVYSIMGGVKALKAGKAIIQAHANEIRQMSIHDAQKFVDDEIFKMTKVRAKWNYYVMPD